MIGYLDGIREERKFVVLLSEGWVLFRRSDQLGARSARRHAVSRRAQPVGVGGDGRADDPPTRGTARAGI